MAFKDGLWTMYPIPKQASIWYGNGIEVDPLEDLDVLISTCVEMLASDILCTDYIQTTGRITQLPSDTVACTPTAKLYYSFQGNRYVKVSYDNHNKQAMLRYYPATITFKRKLTVARLEKLQGDQLIYVYSFILAAMADKELNVLSALNLDSEAGKLDLSVLKG